jgi:hypothetical protein
LKSNSGNWATMTVSISPVTYIEATVSQGSLARNLTNVMF